MKIVTDDSDSDVSPLIYEAAVFYAKDQDVYGAAVKVTIMPIDGLIGETDVCAFVKPVYSKSGFLKEFFVTYDSSFPEVLQLKFLAHEFVHIRQYITGEIVQTADENACIWNGISMTKTERSPWEVEAVGLEKFLLCDFLTSINMIDMINEQHVLKHSL